MLEVHFLIIFNLGCECEITMDDNTETCSIRYNIRWDLDAFSSFLFIDDM